MNSDIEPENDICRTTGVTVGGQEEEVSVGRGYGRSWNLMEHYVITLDFCGTLRNIREDQAWEHISPLGNPWNFMELSRIAYTATCN